MKLNIAKYAGMVDNFINNKAVPVASLQIAKALAVTSTVLDKASKKTGEKAVSFSTHQLMK